MTRASCQIYWWAQQWKKFENRSKFIKVVNEYQVVRFLWPTVYLGYVKIFSNFDIFLRTNSIADGHERLQRHTHKADSGQNVA